MALVIPDVIEESCTTRQAIERLASKWRVLVIYALLAGPQRHAELRRRVSGITQKMLTETLRDMESDGFVERRVLKETPPQHVEYALTALGKTLQEPLAAICAWATEQGNVGAGQQGIDGAGQRNNVGADRRNNDGAD
ncbi:winged helix-turn-helix transcriptional regulator [Actinoplanes derwentensis]|uniref:DNA-binding transcriptional regulator, HxlR family n=1 Tax=Actinoplanes derwentensis TaxID=113562 RepID=A0A1H1Z3R3_9ACTN|nr:helix-turn-helix domain-containing protein [Actinoplanes derwentensis]SDT28391.1 DNA-binding transcriptional regulator, HxlR family [Actinoplanes derwentensis]